MQVSRGKAGFVAHRSTVRVGEENSRLHPFDAQKHDTRRRACLSRDTYYEPYRDADLVPGWSMRESGAGRDSHLAR